MTLAAGGAHAQERDQVIESEAAEVFARKDSDRDGQLSIEEFIKGSARPYGSRRAGVVYQRLPAHFRALDADADGFLDSAEYAGLAPRWQGVGAAPTLAEADRDRDGRIDFREFALLHAPHDDSAAEVAAKTSRPAAIR